AWHEAGSGPPLLCHPGGPGFSSAYFDGLPDLAAQRTLLLLDPRGTGGSDRPADPTAYDLGDYAGDIEALRAHLGLERIDLLGHSHGGFVAMACAAAHPDRPYYADAMAALQAHLAGDYGTDQDLARLYARESRVFVPVDMETA